jgi:hypothetical protein
MTRWHYQIVATVLLVSSIFSFLAGEYLAMRSAERVVIEKINRAIERASQIPRPQRCPPGSTWVAKAADGESWDYSPCFGSRGQRVMVRR